MTRYLSFLFGIFLLFVAPLQTHASTINTSAKQAIVFDYDTGTVLFEKNADEQMPTSSMSKVLTAYLIFDAVAAGTLKLKDTFKVSEKAWRKGGSKMFVEINDNVSIEDLLKGVIIQSGNDATIVLAEGLAGSEESFAELLNVKAKELEMDNSNFVNASGWPDPEHYSTARDLGKLANALLKNHTQFYSYYGEKEFSYSDIAQQNRNPLLYQNIGADGIKTGHTEAGGFGLMGSGQKDGRRVIVVINGLESSSARAQESKKLLQWSLNGFKNEKIVTAGTIIGKAEVLLGQAEQVNLITKEDINLTIPKTKEKHIEFKISYDGPIPAPINKDQKVAKLTISVPGQKPLDFPLYAASTIEDKGLLSKTVYKAKTLIKGQ